MAALQSDVLKKAQGMHSPPEMSNEREVILCDERFFLAEADTFFAEQKTNSHLLIRCATHMEGRECVAYESSVFMTCRGADVRVDVWRCELTGPGSPFFPASP